MKNYMKYFLLMGLVSVASAASLAVDKPQMIVTSEKQDAGDAQIDLRPIQNRY
ncbi:MAG: hypothetical protein P8L77_06050 [Gammaproteobacteria bacterium]|nr:hypothetical protein [Gammaproteobacteria bacterium]